MPRLPAIGLLLGCLMLLAAACGQNGEHAVTPSRQAAEVAPEPTAAALASVPATKLPTVAPATPTGAPTDTPLPDPSPTPTASPEPEYPVYAGPPIDPAAMGVQIHLHREDLAAVLTHLEALGVGWVKSQVSWKLYEPQPDSYDDFRLAELDRLVEQATERGLRVMLSVAKAPEWSRPTTEMDGPPQDSSHFREFMAFLAERYRGRVAAYELWNEPNLQREWNGAPLSAAGLVALIRVGAEGVRAVDGEAILVSAAPATTGINDGIVAIDDRLYLQQMIASGVAEAVDAIGAHPYGWANAPDSTAASPGPEAPSHNDHPSFFFANTLSDYRASLNQAGLFGLPIWVTEFGWGSYQGLGTQPPEGVGYMAYVDEWQQALYIMRAYEMAGGMADLGPMILWNLNFAPTFGSDFVESAYSLLRPDGSKRPAYWSLASLSGAAPDG